MFRRVSLLLLLFVLPLVTACGSAPPAAEPTAAPADDSPPAAAGIDRSQLSEELYFFNWSEYIDPALLAEFEAEYGVRVIEDLYDSNEAMIPKIRAGGSGYDLVVPSDYAVQIMAAENLLAPLDQSLLPNLENIRPDLLDLYFDPGNTYSVPYFWGTTGIAYNSEFFPESPDSWAILFETERLAAIEGRFTVLDDPRETPGAALIYQGHSVNTTDPAILEQTRELLLQQKPYLTAYDSASINLRLSTEEIILAHSWNGAAATARLGIDDKPGNDKINFVIPQEGGVIWMDNLAIVADSPNRYTAHVFINWLMQPEIAARNTDWVLYLTPNAAAEPLLDPETRAIFDAGFAPTPAERERLEWIERTEATELAFADLWIQVIGQ